jgi:hypothetical protein
MTRHQSVECYGGPSIRLDPVENIMICIVARNGTLMLRESPCSIYLNAVKSLIRFEIRYYLLALHDNMCVCVCFFCDVCVNYFQSLLVPLQILYAWILCWFSHTLIIKYSYLWPIFIFFLGVALKYYFRLQKLAVYMK